MRFFFFDELIDSVAGREKNLNLSHAWQDILALHRIKFSFLQLTDPNVYTYMNFDSIDSVISKDL